MIIISFLKHGLYLYNMKNLENTLNLVKIEKAILSPSQKIIVKEEEFFYQKEVNKFLLWIMPSFKSIYQIPF
jgi:hypothetical protein